MAVIRLEALRELERRIVCAIPELTGQVCLGQQAAGKVDTYPSLSIDPIRWRYQPDQADDHHAPAPDRLIVNVGRHESTVQLRLVCATPVQRTEIEQKLLDLFLEEPLHPGVLITYVLPCPEYGEFVAAWELEEDEWADDRAFDNQFASLIVCTGVIPALVTRRDAYRISDLRLGLGDIDSEAPTPFVSSPSVEVVRVNQDGSFEAVV